MTNPCLPLPSRVEEGNEDFHFAFFFPVFPPNEAWQGPACGVSLCVDCELKTLCVLLLKEK